jgi:hypothetical protein
VSCKERRNEDEMREERQNQKLRKGAAAEIKKKRN